MAERNTKKRLTFSPTGQTPQAKSAQKTLYGGRQSSLIQKNLQVWNYLLTRVKEASCK